MGYEDAAATKLLEIHCLCCGRPLLDAVSVTVGIGLDCRAKHGYDDECGEHREEANHLVFEAAKDETTPDRRLEIAEVIKGFGMDKLAYLIVERFGRRASKAARDRAEVSVLGKAPPAPQVTVRLEDVEARLWARGPVVKGLTAVFTPYSAEFVSDLKAGIDFKERAWDGGRRAWLVAPSAKRALLAVLSKHFAGHLAHGPKGSFTVPAAADLPPEPPKGVQDPMHSGAKNSEAAAKFAERDAAQTRASLRAAAAGARPYQVEGAAWLAGMDRALLADDMGLGKTWQALLAAPAAAKILAVVPASVKYNWMDEAKKLRPDLRVAVLEGRGSFRFPAAGEMVVVNYDILPKEFAEEGFITAPGAAVAEAACGVILIADEAQALKNYKSIRHNAVKGLASVCTGGCWLLTGTPVENRAKDLWGLLSVLGVAFKVFGSFDRFLGLVGAFRKQQKVGGGRAKMVVEWPVDAAISPEVNRLLRASVMLRRLKRDVAKDLPPKQYQTIRVNGLDKGLRDDLDDAWESWKDKDELPDFEDFSAIRAALAASRIPAMEELIETYEEADLPVLVFSAHRAPVDAAAKRPGWARISGDESPEERQAVVKRFQAGELKGVALTIRAGGTGLTLTRAADVIFVDKEWNPRSNVQAEDRVHRIGQTAESVRYVDLVSDHPLDLHCRDLIASKERQIAAMVDGE